MKKYSSPIMNVLTLQKSDIVTLSVEYMEENTTFFEDIWGNRFGND